MLPCIVPRADPPARSKGWVFEGGSVSSARTHQSPRLGHFGHLPRTRCRIRHSCRELRTAFGADELPLQPTPPPGVRQERLNRHAQKSEEKALRSARRTARGWRGVVGRSTWAEKIYKAAESTQVQERRRRRKHKVQLQRVNAIFTAFDADCSGAIDRDEVDKLGSQLFGQQLTPAQVDMVLMQMDPDGDGRISRDEFTRWYISANAQDFREQLRVVEREAQTAHLRALFDAADEDGSNEIDGLEAEELLVSLFGTALSDLEQRRALRTMDPGGDGQISFEELVEWYFGAGCVPFTY
eukprot:SAG31_NODE_5240_length_2656_cov_4.684005_1_plen_297_part_00